ncbi:hypothetical protein SAMN05443662_1041 [Sulfurivirga caldicuralii]|uniref:Uncharacterized protein n=1 Tax=Sulfurivirga caldicuralii TaxID=364032 RepID=A0A1N6FE51_9GAMM|nr:hypothetical protein [Sulfurivirga caldicuralii]SIN93486.1 hypothetical protein SAMN05443662_1041 [Sulfurivirga caldicuralii]
MNRKQTQPLSITLLRSEPLDGAALAEALDTSGLLFPLLQAGMVNGYFADKTSAHVMPLRCEEDESGFTLRLDIQFQSQMAGCACDDDPTPQQALTEFMRCTLTFNREGWLETAAIKD